MNTKIVVGLYDIMHPRAWNSECLINTCYHCYWDSCYFFLHIIMAISAVEACPLPTLQNISCYFAAVLVFPHTFPFLSWPGLPVSSADHSHSP